MSEKSQFTFKIRAEERAVLRRLAQTQERSASATLRYLIRQAARELEAGQAVMPNAEARQSEDLKHAASQPTRRA